MAQSESAVRARVSRRGLAFQVLIITLLVLLALMIVSILFATNPDYGPTALAARTASTPTPARGCVPVARPASGPGGVPVAGGSDRLTTSIATVEYLFEPPPTTARALSPKPVGTVSADGTTEAITKLALMYHSESRTAVGPSKLVWVTFDPQIAWERMGRMPGSAESTVPPETRHCALAVTIADAETGTVISGTVTRN